MTAPPRLIDAHLHVLDPGHLSYPWLADAPAIDGPFVATDVETALTPRFVVVQAGTTPEHGLAEARWINSLATDQPIDGIVAFAEIERGAAVAEDLCALAELPRVCGVRRLFQDETPAFFADADLLAGLAEVSRMEWTFDACVRWWQLDELVDLLTRVEDLPVVLDHLGKPPVNADPGSEEGQRWREGIARLARLPHTHVKLSGLPAEASDGSLARSSLGPWLRAAVEVFGVDRAMVGSDWPVSRDGALGLDYDGWFGLVHRELGLTDAESRRLFAGTATDFYRLG